MNDKAGNERSISPVFWLLFGGGGMLAALFGPGLIVLTGFLLPNGIGVPKSFAGYDNALAFARHPVGKLALLAVIALFFWHGAERLYYTLKDVHAGPHALLAWATYGVAAAATVATVVLLFAIGF
jgi:fumarate reductase subunit D